MKRKSGDWKKSTLSIILGLLLAAGSSITLNAQASAAPAPVVPGPILQEGTVSFETPEFTLALVRSSQTVAALKAKRGEGFDFTPGDLLEKRSKDGYYHLGDIDLRLRSGNSNNAGEWKDYSTALARTPVKALPTSGTALAVADLAPTLPADIPLQIIRTWATKDGKLILSFRLTNKTTQPVQIGALGIPIVFNNIINDRTLEEAHARCVFYDPYIGEDAGYLQVTRLNGHGPALLVLPESKTPFEAYKPILNHRGPDQKPTIFEDLTPRGMTFEGFYDWMVHSQAFQEKEWSKATPWNPATAVTLAPGESVTYGVKFVLADSIRQIEPTLAANQRPVAVGIPGYVLPTDLDGRLFLQYKSAVKSISVEPKDALTISPAQGAAAAWKTYSVKGQKWGRARLDITYADGTHQAIHYFVMDPSEKAVNTMGHFLTTKSWYVNPSDPFHRSPSVMSYDREKDAIVAQDSRVWIAGLGDEGGSGSWLAAAMKEFLEPKKDEVDKFQQFIDGVLWGGLQFKEGEHPYGVRKSLFYYQPDKFPEGTYDSSLNWKTWTSWNKEASEDVGRSFNYPHVAAAYWAMYRLARNHTGLVTNHSADWYLNQAYETTLSMCKDAPYYAVFGQMEGDVFLEILRDLKRENQKEKADKLEALMRGRADHWKQEQYPFGSEMPWDSTGQEEVYAWTHYFGYTDKAEVTLNAILGYMPTIPHWGYNGSARRYWDFLYGGKYPRIERQLHHYGSGINSLPVLSEYREHPEDLYLLRVGYGGNMGALTNIDQEGFASAAFHSFPDMLRFDPYSGDYGPNFFGHALGAATYVVHDPQFGWISFGGNLTTSGNAIQVLPRDSYRSRVYLAPFGLWLTLDAGRFGKVELDGKTGAVKVTLEGKTEFTPKAYLRVETLAGKTSYVPQASYEQERGMYVVSLSDGPTTLTLQPKK